MRLKYSVVGAGTVGVLSAIFLLSLLGFFPWSTLNCSTIEIDLCSGKMRSTRYILFIPLKTSISDTPLSRALTPTDRSANQNNWQPVATHSPGVSHSPYYTYHAALGQIRELDLIWEAREVPHELRRTQGLHLLELWEKGRLEDAKQFLNQVIECK
jgi:hypothetical protein